MSTRVDYKKWNGKYEQSAFTLVRQESHFMWVCCTHYLVLEMQRVWVKRHCKKCVLLGVLVVTLEAFFLQFTRILFLGRVCLQVKLEISSYS